MWYALVVKTDGVSSTANLLHNRYQYNLYSIKPVTLLFPMTVVMKTSIVCTPGPDFKSDMVATTATDMNCMVCLWSGPSNSVQSYLPLVIEGSVMKHWQRTISQMMKWPSNWFFILHDWQYSLLIGWYARKLSVLLTSLLAQLHNMACCVVIIDDFRFWQRPFYWNIHLSVDAWCNWLILYFDSKYVGLFMNCAKIIHAYCVACPL